MYSIKLVLVTILFPFILVVYNKVKRFFCFSHLF